MNKKETLVATIKAFFAEEEVINDAFVDVKTSDGLVLRVDEVAVGSTVMIISEDGENVVSEATDFVLEDGVTISVDAEGVITEVKPVEEEGEDMAATQLAKENSLNERLENIEEAILLVVSQFGVQKTRLDELSKQPADEKEVDAGKTVQVKHSKPNAAMDLAKFIQSNKG